MSVGVLKKSSVNMRDSNIELYRIISMLLIVAHHYVVNSGLTTVIYGEPTSARSLFLLVFGAFGKIGINCFVMITGYFMCKSQISAKKFAKLFLEFMFYRLVVNAIFWFTAYEPFTLKNLLNVIVPFKVVAANFTGTFLLFFLFIPFLNKLIGALSEKQHLLLILLAGFTYVFFGTVPGFSVTMNYVSWYMVLFFIASYLRLYPKTWFENTKIWGVLSAVFVALSIASVVGGAFVYQLTGRNRIYDYVTDSNTFLALAVGVSTFMFFKTLKVKPSRFINTVSATCFGVLMIHANGATMRRWLWVDTLNNVGMFTSPYLYVHAILSVIGIFAVCCVIDLLRIRFLEKPFFTVWDKRWPALLEKYQKAEAKILEKLKISS